MGECLSRFPGLRCAAGLRSQLSWRKLLEREPPERARSVRGAYNISTTLYNTQHFQYSLQLYSISTVYTLYNTPLSPSLRACRRRWLAWRLMPSIIRHYDADHLPIRCAPCAASRSVFDRCRASMRARSVFGGGGDSVSVRTANESSAVSSADSISRSAT